MRDKPLPPEILTDALQDRIHPTSGRLLSASPVIAEKLELPVREEYESTEHGQDGYFVLVDADGQRIDLEYAAAALNATARRCDGCTHYPAAPAPGTTVRKYGACAKNAGTVWAPHESCSRWTPRDEPKGEM